MMMVYADPAALPSGVVFIACQIDGRRKDRRIRSKRGRVSEAWIASWKKTMSVFRRRCVVLGVTSPASSVSRSGPRFAFPPPMRHGKPDGRIRRIICSRLFRRSFPKSILRSRMSGMYRFSESAFWIDCVALRKRGSSLRQRKENRGSNVRKTSRTIKNSRCRKD